MLHTQSNQPKLQVETWYQDTTDAHIWYDDSGLLINEPALNEREAYFDVVRVPVNDDLSTGQTSTTYA